MRRSAGLSLLLLVTLLTAAAPPAVAGAVDGSVRVDGFTVEAIEVAIERAAPGDTVIFPGGSYELSRPFGFHSNINYVSDPAAPAVLRYADTATTLTLTDSGTLDNVTIRGLVFDNVRLAFTAARDVTLQDCVFRSGKAASADSAQQWTTEYVLLIRTERFTVDGCTFLRDSSSGGRGVNAYRTTGTVVKDSYFGTTKDLETDAPNGYFKTAVNVNGWAAAGGIGSHSIVLDGNVMRRHVGIPRCVSTADPEDDVCEDHGVYAWGVRDLTVTGNLVGGWTNTSDGGALKVRDSEEVFILGNRFQSSGILTYTHFCAEDKTVTCTDQQVKHLTHVHIEGNRIDVPDAGADSVRGISYWRTATNPAKSTGVVCTGTGFEDIQILNNTFPRGGVVHVHCAEGAKVCVSGNTGGAGTTSWELIGALATSGCGVPESWDQPLAGVHRGDFNGDGAQDHALRVRAGSGFIWQVHLSSGDGYLNQDWGDGAFVGADTERYGVLVADFDDVPADISAHFGMRVDDLNGDGRADIGYRGRCGSPGVPQWRYHVSTPGVGFTISCRASAF